MTDFDTGLGKNAANYTPLSPIDYLRRSAEVYGHRTAIIHGGLQQTWAETDLRCRRLAGALRRLGVERDTTVAALLPNTPAMIEAHFGVPMSGGVLNAINTRLDADSIVFCLQHGEAHVLLIDSEYIGLVPYIKSHIPNLYIVRVDDALCPIDAPHYGDTDYESLLQSAESEHDWVWPEDEWNAITLSYTSGTTGNPKGAVYSHRGASINALSNILNWDMPKHPVYLWTLPLFHCNGWCFAWTVAERAGVNVCLRKFEPELCFDLIREHQVSHYCAAPIVHAALANAPAEQKAGITQVVKGMVAGAAPPEAVLANMEQMGFDITHVYGLTEVYGPAALCVEHDDWAEQDISERARLKARQGLRAHLQSGLDVLDPETMQPVPSDGQSMGELMFRGNIVMKGYLKNPCATEEAFAGGWFHTGDLGVKHTDDYAQIKDRSKDIIVSGGENISSIEVEDVLYKHPAVMNCAVVAAPDAKWGEIPLAFVELKPERVASDEELTRWCADHLARFKLPRQIIFGELPKTATGKIQKFELREQAKTLSGQLPKAAV